ncbi:MAG: CDP-alcohol phosphatidyltransferase family protein [Bacteroidia bacterium]|nr:CDP-alcohol phosphatidyltransferase family protein [Bacteroidia bacterium]
MKKSFTPVGHIPNFLSSLNLLSGCIAIVMTFNGKPEIAAWFIGIAAIFDFFDGLAARTFKAYSNIGKELDSLADMISFGFAPSAIMYKLIETSLKPPGIEYNEFSVIALLPFIAFLIAIFSALRLAKFNVDTRQKDSFIGLATPANSIFIASLPLIIVYQHIDYITAFILNIWFLIPSTFILSFLLVAEYPMFSFKFKTLLFRENRIRYIFIAISVILLIFFHYLALPFIIILYILLSGINNLLKYK